MMDIIKYWKNKVVLEDKKNIFWILWNKMTQCMYMGILIKKKDLGRAFNR